MTNVALCNAVADWAEHALTHQTPVGFDMSDWISSDVLWMMSFDPETGGDVSVPVENLKEGSCGTAACVAGYVTIFRAPEGTTTTGSTLYLPDGSTTDCDKFARQELDIDGQIASLIFYASNETAIKRLRYLAENPDATPFDLSNVFAG